MTSGRDRLAELNARIAAAETGGDRSFFESLLAPAFAMRRANGVILNRDAFIEAVAKSPERTTEIESLSFHGASRATVLCVVAMDTPEGPKRFHNFRLFVREKPQDSWSLMAWANEVVD